MIFNSSAIVIFCLLLMNYTSCNKESPPAKPDVNFILNKWKVFAISETGVWELASTVPYSAYFTFNGTTEIKVKLDVNNCAGAFGIPEINKIDFNWYLCTKVCCDSTYGKKIITLLPELNNYTFSHDTLTLGNGSPKIKLIKI